jgi:sulfite reductase beta subunit-like hemoprotein
MDDKQLRLYGVYRQDKDGHFMLRVKIPAGLLTSDQADTICTLSEQLSNGLLHLTSRGSIEFHWLKYEHLEEVFKRLDSVGLTTRGACGGAVRGISCSTTFVPGFTVVQRVAQRINRHFAGNSDFEGLPKKFKVGVDASYHGSRHLIQDVGLVMVDGSDKEPVFDVWCAGGLGREPQAAFLLEHTVLEHRVIHLIESVVHIYRENTPPPKRLKSLVNTIGEDEFRRLLHIEMEQRPQPEIPEFDADTPLAPDGNFLEIPVFAGEIESTRLRQLATISRECAGGYLATTANQNIALLASSTSEVEEQKKALLQHQIKTEDSESSKRFRVCPGNHECRMGLSPTREIAHGITAAAHPEALAKSWAISGCHNSCSQPQLADFGIVTKKLHKAEDGSRQPLFDLYQRDGHALGKCVAEGLTASALYEAIRTLK